MATNVITARFKITDWNPKPMALAQFMAKDKTLQARVAREAALVARQARINVGGGRHNIKVVPKQKKVLGYYWITSPYKIQQSVKVKDGGKSTFPNKGQRYPIYVMLVVADHPYARPHEYGGMGFKQTRFMRKAGATASKRNPGTTYRKRKGDGPK